jgi:hypothetical protein
METMVIDRSQDIRDFGSGNVELSEHRDSPARNAQINMEILAASCAAINVVSVGEDDGLEARFGPTSE